MHPLEQRAEEYRVCICKNDAKNAIDAHVSDVNDGVYQRDWKDEFQGDVVLAKLT